MTDKQKENLFLSLYLSGDFSVDELCRKVGIDSRTYTKWKEKHFAGIRKPNKTTPEEKEIFVRLCYDRTLSINDVCQALGISKTCFYNWQRELMPPDFNKNKLQYLRFVDLYKLGNLSLTRIAGLLGCWQPSTWRYKRRYLKEKEAQNAMQRTLGEKATDADKPNNTGASLA